MFSDTGGISGSVTACERTKSSLLPVLLATRSYAKMSLLVIGTKAQEAPNNGIFKPGS